MTSDPLTLVPLAVILSTLGVASVLALFRLLFSNPARLPAILFTVLGLAIIIFNIFSPRLLMDFNPSTYLKASEPRGDELWVRIIQATVVLYVLICSIGMLVGIKRQKRKLNRDANFLVACGLLAFLPIILSALLSEHGGFTYGLFLFPLFVVTTYLNPQRDFTKGIKAGRFVLLCFVYGSLASMLLAPAWAYSSLYTSSLVGLNIRLFGVAGHANSLGYVSLASLILSRLDEKESNYWFVHILAALMTLFLSQSKTAWVVFAIWMIFELLLKLNLRIRHLLSGWLLGGLVLISIFLTLLLLEANINDTIGNGLITLTGRTLVWQKTYEIWLQNPVLGYGPSIWNMDFRLEHGSLWAGQSHNQFLQTLGESGAIGLVGLLFYFAVLIKLGGKYIVATAGASFAFVIMLLARSLTETPVRNYLLDESFLIHAILFFILANLGNVQRSSSNKMCQISQGNYARFSA